MSAGLTIVLPLRIDSAGTRQTDLDRFALLLWPTFLQLWASPGRLQWLLVCPADDLQPVRDRVAALPGDTGGVEVIPEDELLPTLAGQRGWHKQQLIKLAASQRVATTHYLTLDADVLLLRTAGIEDLIPDGQPLLGDRRGRDHPDWWAGSAKMLRSSMTIAADDNVMGVTPAILQTALARRVLGEVAGRNGVEDGARFLFDGRREQWSEYTLYWLLALESGQAASYRRDGRPLYTGVFGPADNGKLHASWLQREYKKPAGPVFCVVQSKQGHAISNVGYAIRPLVDLPHARAYQRSVWQMLRRVWLT